MPPKSDINKPGINPKARAKRDAAVTAPVVYDSRPDTYAHIGVVRGYLLTAVLDLAVRAHTHDFSKLSGPELPIFDEYTPKLRDVEYGSDDYESCRVAMGVALEHHYAKNDHHPEHHVGGIDDMNLIQMIEMLCDWMAAAARHPHGDIRKSITSINKERFGYGDAIERLMLNTVDVIERATA